jgi:hypothetical protein
MTTPTDEQAAQEAAEAKWQSFVADKACCAEHAVKDAFLAGATWGRAAGMAESAEIAERAHPNPDCGQNYGGHYSDRCDCERWHIAQAIRALLPKSVKTSPPHTSKTPPPPDTL